MKKTDSLVKILETDIKDKDILEVACGAAEFSLSASRIAKSVSCIDLDDKRLNDRAGQSNIHFRIMDAANMTYPDGTFDTIVLYNAFFHVKDQWKEIEKECRRVMKPDGVIYIVGTWSLDTSLMTAHFGDDAFRKAGFLIVKLSNYEIHPTEKADLESIRSLWADGEVMKYVGFPEGLSKSPDEMEEWLERIKSERPVTDHFSIYSGGRYCGESFYSINTDNGVAALDIKLLPFARGKGIAQKALRHAIDQAFANGARKCYTDPNPENERAIALYKRAGMIQKEMPEALYDEDYPGYLYFETER